jgi:hypothetical protein
MQGVHFIVNEKGERTGVVLDLKKHGDLWEDVFDRLVARQRKHEPRETLHSVKERLQRQGKLRAHE